VALEVVPVVEFELAHLENLTAFNKELPPPLVVEVVV